MSSALSVGTLLQGGKYRIERTLGQGGFGITYLAEHMVLMRKVCIKQLHIKDLFGKDDDGQITFPTTSAVVQFLGSYHRKFIQEARTVALLDHPGIVRIYDVFEEYGAPFYVMDYLEGENLKDLVGREGALPEDRAVNYIRQVAEALSYVHGKSIMHLDVKPSNVIVRKSDNRAILIDFGTAKRYDSPGNLTSTTPIGLSAGYAPIEMMKVGGLSTFSPETDIYSLGATLYFLVTGHNPPESSDVLDEGLPPMPDSVSASVQKAITAAMAKRRLRPKSMEDFLAMLDGGEKPDPFGIDFLKELAFLQDSSEAERQEAVRSFRKAAEQGNACAQYCMGHCRQYGLGTRKNYLEAVYWYRMAAEQGNSDAQTALGWCIQNGMGVTKDYYDAVSWYKKAADQGNSYGQFRLGWCYYHGFGVQKSKDAALAFLKKAADGGHEEAKRLLGASWRLKWW